MGRCTRVKFPIREPTGAVGPQWVWEAIYRAIDAALASARGASAPEDRWMRRKPAHVALSLILSFGLIAAGWSLPAGAAAPAEDLAPIVGSWQIAAMSAEGYPFYIQYTFTSDGIVWVFVPDGRHGSGHWEEDAHGQVTMSFVIQSGTEAVPYVERIWERFPMPRPAPTPGNAVRVIQRRHRRHQSSRRARWLRGGPASTCARSRQPGRIAPPSASPGPSVSPPSPGRHGDAVHDLGIGTSPMTPVVSTTGSCVRRRAPGDRDL